MRILVTNDDGVSAPGIAAVAKVLIAAGHDVVVAAPDRNFSGCGTSLGPVGDGAVIRFEHLRMPDFDGATDVLSVQAPPAAIVLAVAQAGFDGWSPDCVVSGINNGFNTGRAAIHSGTLSAALTAGSLGMPAIAVSAEVNAVEGLRIAGDVVEHLVGAEGGIAGVLNVNVPETPDPLSVVIAEPGGISMTDLEYTRSGSSWIVRKAVAVEGFHPGGEGEALLQGHITLSSPSRQIGVEALHRMQGVAERALVARA